MQACRELRARDRNENTVRPHRKWNQSKMLRDDKLKPNKGEKELSIRVFAEN